MKFNPYTNILYTDDDRVIKKMFCPYTDLQWDDLSPIQGSQDRLCDICENTVMETINMSDNDLFKLLQEKPDTCLKINMNASNIRMAHNV